MSNLYDHQEEALSKLKNGSILVGDVGSGKSRTAIAYYIQKVCVLNGNKFEYPRDLFIITTAKKRDSLEWWNDIHSQKLYENHLANPSKVHIFIDSWNNIKKYKDIYGAFFIFDEQRVVGSGAWVKAFLKITKKNQWILLSATPGDKYEDYIPVFIANGFYKNKTEFQREHIVYDRFSKYPKVERYLDIRKMNYYRQKILVRMKDPRKTTRINIKCSVSYNKQLYSVVWKDRWDPYDKCPIKETGKLFYLMRKVVNSDESRITKVQEVLTKHHKVIIFYNFNYELCALRDFMDTIKYKYSEWNGQKHEEVPSGNKWVYLVQYTAGAEGWNCIETDTIIFYSQTYSYRSREQAAGRIDRMNTPFRELFYYHFVSYSPIDLAIQKALQSKKNFNEKNYISKNS